MPIYLSSGTPQPPSNPLIRVLVALATAALAVLAVVFGFAIFLVFLVIALIGGGIMSWRFRKIRKQMAAAMDDAAESAQQAGQASSRPATTAQNAEIIEGDFEVIERNN